MMFNHVTGDRVYLGSNQGLMYVDVSANNPAAAVVSSSTTCNVALCGKVLDISNDGKQVVIADNVSTTSQVYIYNGSTGAAPIDLIIPNEVFTAASFSPDQSKIFILTSTGRMYVYSTVDALTSVPIATSVTDIKFSADGSFAYLAGNPAPTAISAFATCDARPTVPNLSVSPDSAFVTTPGVPYRIFPSPDAQHVLVFDPENGSIDNFATVDQIAPLPYDQYVCGGPPPLVNIDPTVNFPAAAQSYNLGQTKNFLPVLGQLVADGTQFIVVARQLPAVLIFDVNQGTTTSVPLTDPLGGDSLDQVGDTQLSAALNLDQSGGGAGGNSALVYNSDAVSSRPIIQATINTPNNAALPGTITATLTWNGTAGSAQNFSTSGMTAVLKALARNV